MRVASDFRELARRALSGKWVSAVLTTLVASILGADIMVNGGSSTSGITNSVTNVVNRGNGDSSYNGILSTMSITSLTYILGWNFSFYVNNVYDIHFRSGNGGCFYFDYRWIGSVCYRKFCFPRINPV